MLNRRTYFIREHIGILKLTDAYDILDPTTQEQLGIAKERVDTIFHILRLVVEKRLLPIQRVLVRFSLCAGIFFAHKTGVHF